MSDHEDPPTDLFDAICRLDDIAEFLLDGWPDEAEHLREFAHHLKGFVEIRLAGRADAAEREPGR